MGLFGSFQIWLLKAEFIWTQAEFSSLISPVRNQPGRCLFCTTWHWKSLNHSHCGLRLYFLIINISSFFSAAIFYFEKLHVNPLPVVSEDFFKYLQGGAGDRGVQAMGEWCFDCIWSSHFSISFASSWSVWPSFEVLPDKLVCHH